MVPAQQRALAERGHLWGFAADEFYSNAYGDELRLGTLFPENVDELDVLIFGGDVRVAAPEAPSVAKVSSLAPWERM